MKYIFTSILLTLGVISYSQSDVFGQILDFDGGDLSVDGDYVEIDDDPTLNFDGSSSFSIQFRMYPRTFLTAAGTKQGLVTKKTQTGPGYGVFWEVTASTSRIVFELNDGVNTVRVESSDIPNINVIRWTNVSAVVERDANGINDSIWLYIDGEVVDKKESGVIGSVSNTDKVYLMRSAADPSQTNAGGYLDDIRIWNTALTERQVRRIYNEPIYEGLTLGLVRTVVTDRFTTLLWSSLMMYLDIEDPLGTFVVFDKSLNSNDGGFYEGPSGVLCSTSGCGPAFIIPPVGEKPPNFTCNSTGDWSSPSTWVGGVVPTNSDRTTVFVLDGAELTIDPLTIYKVKEINVAEGGTLISDKNSLLQITKYFDIDGTYKTNDGGAILFDEVGNHTIDGSGTGTLDFFNLTLFQNSQLQINVPVNVFGVFAHVNGRVRTGDQMTIKSNVSNTDEPYGRIAASSVGAPDVVGLIKMELELTSTNAGWRQMAFPFSGNFGNFQGLTLNLNNTLQAEQNVFYWDNNADLSIPANNAGWTSPSATSNQVRAYSIYLDENNFSFTNPITFEGEYNPGDKVYPLTYLNDPGSGVLAGQPGYENGVGWNFIPNLYPSLLDADEMTTNNPLQYKNIHIWDAKVQQYKSFVENPGTSENIIPYNNAGRDAAELSAGGIMPFQGFWVKTTDNTETSFTLQNSWRGVSFSNLNPQQSLKRRTGFQLNVFSAADSTWDGALISFDETADSGFEVDKDVYKLISQGDVPSLSFDLGNALASINRINNTEQHTKLNFRPSPSKEDGTYHFHLNHDYTSSGSSIYLEDLFTGVFTDLKESDYSFKNYGNPSERFKLHYYPLGKPLFELQTQKITSYANEVGIVVRFDNISNARAKVLISNVIGQEVYRSNNVSTEEDFIYPVDENTPLTYIVTVITNDATVSTKIVR